MKLMKVFLIIWLFLVFGLWLFSEELYANNLELVLESENLVYVYREPVKFCVTFNNISNTDIRIPHYELLEGEMKYIYMDIIYPDGSRKLKAVRHIFEYGIAIQSYGGMIFRGGDSFTICYYPNESMDFNPEKFSYNSRNNTPTFTHIGEYRIKFVYIVPELYSNLYQPGVPVESNEIVIRIKKPSIEEMEIFDAYWAGGEISYSDFYAANKFNRDELTEVIDKFPDNPMIKYAKYGLAVEIGCSRNEQRDQRLGLNMMNEILDEYPGFRHYEIQKFRLRYLVQLGENDTARRLYKKMLRNNRNMMCIKVFITMIAAVEYGWDADDPFTRDWKSHGLKGDMNVLYESLVAE